MGTNVTIIIELSTISGLNTRFTLAGLAICRWLGLFFEHLFEYPQP